MVLLYMVEKPPGSGKTAPGVTLREKIKLMAFSNLYKQKSPNRKVGAFLLYLFLLQSDSYLAPAI